MNTKLYSITVSIREPSSNGLDLDVCCQDHDVDFQQP